MSISTSTTTASIPVSAADRTRASIRPPHLAGESKRHTVASASPSAASDYEGAPPAAPHPRTSVRVAGAARAFHLCFCPAKSRVALQGARSAFRAALLLRVADVLQRGGDRVLSRALTRLARTDF